jgi:hypothetical protein
VGVKKDTVYVVKSELKRYMSEKGSGKLEASGKYLPVNLLRSLPVNLPKAQKQLR